MEFGEEEMARVPKLFKLEGQTQKNNDTSDGGQR